MIVGEEVVIEVSVVGRTHILLQKQSTGTKQGDKLLQKFPHKATQLF